MRILTMATGRLSRILRASPGQFLGAAPVAWARRGARSRAAGWLQGEPSGGCGSSACAAGAGVEDWGKDCAGGRAHVHPVVVLDARPELAHVVGAQRRDLAVDFALLVFAHRKLASRMKKSDTNPAQRAPYRRKADMKLKERLRSKRGAWRGAPCTGCSRSCRRAAPPQGSLRCSR